MYSDFIVLKINMSERHITIDGESENSNQNGGNQCGLDFVCMGDRKN